MVSANADIFTWMIMPSQHVGAAEATEPRTPRTARGLSTRIPQTPRTPSQFLAHTPLSPVVATPTVTTPSRLDASARPFVPARNLLHNECTPNKDDEHHLDSEHAIMKARILGNLDQDSSDSGNDLDSDETSLEYAHLKVKIADLTSNRRVGDTADSSNLQDLRARLEKVKKNYFFNERDAEARYLVERRKADAVALKARLQGLSTAADSPRVGHPKGIKKRPPNLLPQASVPPVAVIDIFDEEVGESSGGLFEALEEMPTTVTSDRGTTVTVRDMALPKHWSGRTPKTLLTETVSKADKYAAITYTLLSGDSRAKRAAVSIRWDGRKTDDFSMDDVACHTEAQAEQYIATIALHELTFPSRDTFTAAAPSGGQTFFRLLPAVFRDLWDELETTRRSKTDALNRGVWAKLRSIIEPKLEVAVKVAHPQSPHLKLTAEY